MISGWLRSARLPNTDEDTREQLLEAETTRHREALQNLGMEKPTEPASLIAERIDP